MKKNDRYIAWVMCLYLRSIGVKEVSLYKDTASYIELAFVYKGQPIVALIAGGQYWFTDPRSIVFYYRESFRHNLAKGFKKYYGK